MKISACLIVKDEERYLLEWLSYYLALGFDEVVVYDNNSQDGTAQLMQTVTANDTRVRYQFWPDLPGHAPQRSAYQDALNSLDADWIAFFDIDEYLMLRGVSTIHDLMEIFPCDASAVSINWRHFGSSGNEVYTDELVLDRFRLGPPRSFFRNEFVKSIIRPECTRAMTAHIPHLADGVHYRADGSLYPRPGHTRAAPTIHHPAQLNHYVIKSREEYLEKWRRGRATMPPDDPERVDKFGEEHWQRYDINEERDDAADAWLDVVRQGIDCLTAPRAMPLHGCGSGETTVPCGQAKEDSGSVDCRATEQALLERRVVEGSLRYIETNQQVRIRHLEGRLSSLEAENRRLKPKSQGSSSNEERRTSSERA